VSETDPVTTDPVATTTEPEVAATAPETTTTVESAPATSPAAETPEAEVADAIQFFNQQWQTCLEQLPNCDLDAVMARRGIADVGVVQGEAIRFNNNDYRAANIDAYVYHPSNIVVDGTSATADVCVTDPIVLTEADGTIVDDTYFSYVLVWTLSKPADVWIVESRESVSEYVTGAENDLCAPN
jgi:hypothetical protein